MANKLQKKHHKKNDLCYSRPSYREANWERAVKVYTINQESKYLLIIGVPSVGVVKELIELCALYGPVEEYRLLDEYPAEEYTDVYWVKFKKIQSARFAKRKLDNRSFFGGVLHVCYAPEYETVDDTREKLQERRKLIAKKCKEYNPRQDNTLQSASQSVKHCEVIVESDSRTTATTGNNFSEIQHKTFATNLPVAEHKDISLNVQNTSEQGVLQYLSKATVFPALPPPPVPLNHYPSLAPSLPYEYPWVPTKHATFPEDGNTPYKTLTEHGKHANTGANSSDKSTAANCSVIQVKNSLKPSVVDTSISRSQFLKRKAEPRIIFRQNTSQAIKSNDSTSDSSDISQLQLSEPTAWDPYHDVRKREKSHTGVDSLDSLSLRVRQKLKKVSEPRIEPNTDLYDVNSEYSFEHVPPIRKNKTRKRI